MLFTSNEKYPNQAAFTGALNKMGVANWNGATGTEYINYYITVPSDKIGDGIEFWSWAVKKPLFDADKLKSEKDVVINEIRGYHSDPDEIMEMAAAAMNASAPRATPETRSPAMMSRIAFVMAMFFKIFKRLG